MTDALKGIASDPNSDRRVKKKLTLVLTSWREQYKDDPSMSVVASLYKQCIGARPPGHKEMAHLIGLDLDAEERKKQEKRAAKQKLIEANKLAKQQRELRAKKLQEEKSKKKRVPFDFEKVRVLVIALGCGLTDINDQEKPKVLSSIVEASQASNNLQNAIQVDIFFERVSPIFTSS